MEQLEHTEPPRKKLAEMTSEERRAYNAQSKRKSRDKAKQERLAAIIPQYSDYQLPDTQRDQLAENARQFTATIRAELSQELTAEDQRMVDMLSDVLVTYEWKWVKEVHSPRGVLYGRYFPDGAASELIEHFHRAPNLLESPTLTTMYQKFLKLAQTLSRQSWFDQTFAQQVQAEIDGVYTLPPAPQIPKAPEPAPPPQAPIPSFAEISEASRNRMMERLSDQLSPDAREYLFGGNR